MKNRASLVLMEQLVMILVFALAAALCLRSFAVADRISHETEVQDKAILTAQNAAETLKATAGEEIPEAPEGLYLEITPLTSEVPGLEKAEIAVFDAETDALLFSLITGWQEVG